MVDKLFIPKSILQGIANAIRNKTGGSASIKVKDMPTAIQNIPSGGGGAKISTSIKDTGLEEVGGTTHLYGVLDAEFIEKDSLGSDVEIKSHVNNATVKIEGANTGEDYQPITQSITNANGAFDTVVTNYEEYKIHFEGTENIKSSEKHIKEGYIRFLVSPERHGGLTAKALQEGANLRVYKENALIHNTNGVINESFTEDTEFVYKGVMHHLKGWYDQSKEVEINTDIESIDTSEINLHYNNVIEKIIFKEPCTVDTFEMDYGVDNCSNLKIVRLPSSIRNIQANVFSDCRAMEYINIPPIQAITDGTTLVENNNLITLELESGLNINVVRDCFGLTNNNNRLKHLILVGEPLNKEVDNLSYEEDWTNMPMDSVERRISFQPDTYRILENTVSSLSKVHYIDFPVMLGKIENNAFNSISSSKHPVLRFEGYVPPQFGGNNDPEDVFQLSGSINIPYKVMCPYQAYDAYYESFGSSGFFEIVDRDNEEYPTEDDGGEFSITIRGTKLKSTTDDLICMMVEREAYYYLDNVLAERSEGVKDTYWGDKLDFTFEDYGVHTFTVAGGFTVLYENAFKYNQEIIKVRLPYALETILNDAFYGCSNLKTLIFRDSPPEIVTGAFDGLNPDCTVYVPETYSSEYQAIPDLNQYRIVPYATDYEEE